MDETDVVVIGSGSAGSAVAGRLAEVPGLRVTVLEAGSTDTNPWLHVPIGYAKTMYHPTISWNYQTEAEPGLGGRSIPWPRGRVLGGSSAINGLIYIRGQAEDYDTWRQMGCTGWGFDDCLPYFRRAQRQERGASALHGGDGPLSTTDLRDKGELSEAFIKAAEELGFPRNEDFNGTSQEGAGWYQVTVRDGFRCSAATAYLKPAVKAGRVRLITDAHVTRILVEGGRAVGVAYRVGNEERVIRAAREVVLSGGAINSPQVMMLSGLGPAAHLQEMGIPVVRDMPAVGQHLQDHYQARLMYRASRRVTMNERVNSWLGMAAMGVQYALTRRGPLTFAAGTSGLFARVLPQSATPDVQFHFIPWSADSVKEGLHRFPGFTISVCQLRPESRGAVTLASPDPMAKPKMLANYLSTETDRRCMVEGVKLGRRLARTAALGAYIESEHTPGASAPDTDEALLAFVREKGGTIYHPTSTCRMGADEASVVDVELRVRGVERLRIADASVMPAVVSGNTNAGCIMIGERCADFMKRAA
ncbi:MAG: GMC family oxidoreductase N-terminal domain-containing protein [Rubritepida sp.]|nr:GMC family oxidoreductase N-terminal domain-containing protein [Rubritepida sp.]